VTGADWARWRVILLCAAAMALAFMDRQILPLFVEQIRADLKISDVQFALLTGLAFSIFYGLCGVPIGRLVDSRPRPVILGVGLAVWSAATAATGLCRSFAQVFVARMAVGVGETTVSPASQSMATDLFLGRGLARAISTVSIGVGIGQGAALLLGGALAKAAGKGVSLPIVGSLHPWQFAFLVLGLPGLVLAPIMLAVRDPKRLRLVADAAGAAARPTYVAMLRFIWTHRATVAFNALGYTVFTLATGALAQWAPAHFIRVFHAPVAVVGVRLGLMQMVGVTVGLLVAGWRIDRGLDEGRPDSAMRFSMTCAGLALPAMLAFPFMPTLNLGMLTAVIASSLCGAGYATAAVSSQQLMPNQMRAQYAATYLVFSNLIGGTLAPLAVAGLNGAVFHDPKRIGVAAALVGGCALCGTIVLLGLGLRHFRASLAEVDRAALP
jgi:MFS family permease